MASSGRRKVTPNLPEQVGAGFFNIILQSTVRDRKMLIPRKFVTDFAGGLLKWKSATLKTGDGEEWEVGLVKVGKQDVSFGNHGWERFAQYYSLEYGHSLFFKYRGRSTFSVDVFDRSGMGIDYFPTREALRTENDAAAAEQVERDDGKGKSPMANDDADSTNGQMNGQTSRNLDKAAAGDSSKMVMGQEEKQGSKGEAAAASKKPSSSSRKRRAH